MSVWTWMDQKSFDGYPLCTTIAWILGLQLSRILCLGMVHTMRLGLWIFEKIHSIQVNWGKCTPITWWWVFKFLKNLIQDQSCGSLKMDWQKVSQKPQFWKAITWTQRSHFPMERSLPGFDDGHRYIVPSSSSSVQSSHTKWHFREWRHYFGFPYFWFHCQDLAILLNYWIWI